MNLFLHYKKRGYILTTKEVIELASKHLEYLPGRSFDIFNIAKPSSPDEAIALAKLYKIVSKVSSLVGNLIEFDAADYLNSHNDYKDLGKWVRQDPGFPDIILDGAITPTPGFEVKAWYPFSTEITGRFKDSQNHFIYDQTYVMLLAWLPEFIIYGKPMLIDILIVSGKSVAKTRDDHYHQPPKYIVLEPEDTSKRTRNLQQTNTNGYVFQDGEQKLKEAENFIKTLKGDFKRYSPSTKYQSELRKLFEKYKYRLDTNYAKIDRIDHPEIEKFKTKVLDKVIHGLSVKEWYRLISNGSESKIREVLYQNLPL